MLFFFLFPVYVVRNLCRFLVTFVGDMQRTLSCGQIFYEIIWCSIRYIWLSALSQTLDFSCFNHLRFICPTNNLTCHPRNIVSFIRSCCDVLSVPSKKHCLIYQKLLRCFICAVDPQALCRCSCLCEHIHRTRNVSAAHARMREYL